MPPGYQRISPGDGWAVASSNGTPRSKSPSGIQHDSPLQRTWIILFSYGSSERKAAHVCGAFWGSRRAKNSTSPLVMRIICSAMVSPPDRS
jgi:hypothetical protein